MRQPCVRSTLPALALFGVLATTPAFAAKGTSDTAPEATTEEDDNSLISKARTVFPRHDVQRVAALTLSAGLTETVMIELQGEFNLPGQHSVSAIVGFGAWPGTAQAGWLVRVRAGGQYRYTLVGDFDRGLYAGAEALFEIIPSSPGPAWSIRPTGIFGGKYTTDFGLVFDINAGLGARFANFAPPRVDATFNVGLGFAFGKTDRSEDATDAEDDAS